MNSAASVATSRRNMSQEIPTSKPQQLATPPRQPRSVVLGCVLVLIVFACAAPPHRQASFFQKPDTTQRGNPLGPFTGTVVDEETDTPVSGALVLAIWEWVDPAFSNLPRHITEAVATTDTNGAYTVSKLRQDIRHAHVANVAIIIYKRGYVAYRSDTHFEDFAARHDFSQTNNQVQLVRWQRQHSHARHMRFLGASEVLSPLASWEVPLAVAELSGDTRGSSQNGNLRLALRASQLLLTADLLAATGYRGSFLSGPLADTPDTDLYSSQHFQALGKTQAYDVAIRVWNIQPDELEGRWQELMSVMPEHTVVPNLFDRAAVAQDAVFRSVAIGSTAQQVVVLVTCGQGLCTTEASIITLAKQIERRILNLKQSPTGWIGD